MKINFKVRFKNPTFWVGIIIAVMATVLAQLGLSWDQVTSWTMLGQVLLDAVSSPVTVVAVISTVYNAIVDPTTAGLSDSKNALTYTKPKKE